MKKSRHIDNKTPVNNKTINKMEIKDDLKRLTMEDENLGTPVVREIKKQLSPENILDYKLDSTVLQRTAKSKKTEQNLSATTALQTERANYRKYDYLAR